MEKDTPVTFFQCLQYALHQHELVENFDRLFNCSLSKVKPLAPIEILVDRATGYDKIREAQILKQMNKFTAFVWECVWTRLPWEARETAPIIEEFLKERYEPIWNEIISEQ